MRAAPGVSHFSRGLSGASPPAPDETRSVRELIATAASRLDAAGVPTPRLDAEVLLADTLGVSRTALHAHPERLVDEPATRTFEDRIRRRERREPVAYILGRKEFWSLDFEVTPEVLIPRPETERVVEIAVGLLLDLDAGRPAVCDVGTGSGCIAVAIANEVPNAVIVATDLSTEALQLARRNVMRHAMKDRVKLVRSDLLAGLGGRRFDVVVSNPPYVEADADNQVRAAAQHPGRYPGLMTGRRFRAENSQPQRGDTSLGARGVAPGCGIANLAPEVRHEPALALFAGADGLETIPRLIPECKASLKPGGWLIMELGATQGSAVESIARESGFSEIRIENDYAGLPRVLVARAGLE